MSARRNTAVAQCFCCEAPVAAGKGWIYKYTVEHDGFNRSTDVVKCELCKSLGITLKPARELRDSISEIFKPTQEN